MPNPFLKLKPGTITPLDGSDGLPASGHLWETPQIDALTAAHAAQRPLLVRGEAGSGKSQLARAAARILGTTLHKEVIHARFEARDLLYRFDSLQRLADAQAHLTDKVSKLEAYVRHGKLWQAVLDCQPRKARPVLLLDEIDKAEAEVPNGLLEALGNGRFSVPLLGEVVRRPDDVPAPLVVITTNDERELPPAFLRRCLVLTLQLPRGRALEAFLVKRGRLHFPALAERHPAVLQGAAEMLREDRRKARAEGIYEPGLSEYLDLLRAIESVGGDPMQRLADLRAFTFVKQPLIGSAIDHDAQDD